MIERLKPCPFCGGEPRMFIYYPYDGYQREPPVFRMACLCGAMIEKQSEDEAFKAWNRRSDV